MKTISIYQVEDEPIGSGGMGRVLQGIDPQGRRVAVKEILPEFASDLEIRTRTEREVELLQKLNNDSIVKVYDQFPLGDNFYIVMELVDGMNIEQYVQTNGAIPYEQSIQIMIKILEAMQFVHERQFVHRDMKPSNIMIRNDKRICILDFGIAKDMGNQRNGTYTIAGTIIGSDGYMSPEQAEGLSIDHRADIYALGCVFYYMLTGHHAYDTLSSDYETRANIAKTPFPKLSKYSKNLFPSQLQIILDHATDRNMMKRYQSCREFRTDLERILPRNTKLNPNNNEEIFITVGREGCDILINDDFMKVSRSHLDITFRQFTGGRYYVISDHSSNGTLVNGRRLNRGESEMIHADNVAPQIFLACDSNYPLNWEEVKQLIISKIKEKSLEEKEDPIGKTQQQLSGPGNETPEEINSLVSPHNEVPDVSFKDAIKLFFTRALDFGGRSRRKEFWFVYLFNFLVSFLCIIILVYSILNNISVMTSIFMVLLIVYSIAVIIPGISLTIRRLHDINKSGYWLLLLLATFIPILNIIILIFWIVLMCTDSDPFENEWGKCPK